MTSVTPHTDNFYNIVSQPVKYCSKFYGYLYLDQAVDDVDVGFDYVQFKGDLMQAFVEYGHYAISHELTNIGRHAGFKKKHVISALKKYGEDETAADLEAMMSGFETQVPIYSYNDLVSITRLSEGFDSSKVDERVHEQVLENHFGERYTKSLEMTLYNVATGPEDVAAAEKQTAQIKLEEFTSEVPQSTQSDYFKNAKILFQDLDWQTAFGQDAWADIAKLLISRNERKDTLVIDGLWQLEHNMGQWLSKTVNEPDEDYYREAIRILKNNIRYAPREISRLVANGASKVGDTKSMKLLNKILDIKRESELWKIYPWIVASDRQLAKHKDVFKQAGQNSPY